MTTRTRSSLAGWMLGMPAVFLLAAPTAGNAWTCTPVYGTLVTATTLTKVDPIEQLAAGIIPGERCRDLEFLAEQEGISLEEAIENYAWQSPFGHLVNQIREKFPEDFTGSWIEDSVKGFISFTGTAPAEAVEAVRAFPRDIRIIENRGFTEAGLTKRHQIVHDIISGYEEVTGITSSPDITTGQIEVAVALHDAVDTPAKKADLLDRIRAGIPAGRDGTTNDVSITVLNPLLEQLLMRTGLGGNDEDTGNDTNGVDLLAFLLLAYPAAAGLFLAPFLLYETLTTAALGRTIGKHLTRIQTIHTPGGQTPRWTRTTARWAALHLPLLIPLAGIPIFLLTAASPLFDPQRRGWHDKITRTAVTPDPQPSRSNTRPPAKTGRRLAARLIDWTICAAAGLALTILTLWLLGLEGHLY